MTDPIKIKADIVPYTVEYSSLVRSWINTEKVYYYVCRGKEFPPPEDIVESWQRKDVSAFLLFSDNKPVAYGELWARPLERAIELSHLIVDPYKRSKGYGTKLLNLLYNRASTKADVTKVLINLYNDSTVALGCYLKAGFELVGTANYTMGLRMVKLVKK